jgi:hypothetical protein
MSRIRLVWVLVGLLASSAIAYAFHRQRSSEGTLDAYANLWLESLDPSQRTIALLPYEGADRVQWHFIPKETRKGLPLKQMNDAQRGAALRLLRASMSELGYDKAAQIMLLESVLRKLEGAGSEARRDPDKYYFTLFGTPAAKGKWGLSIEGHHLSINLVVEDGQVIDSTPQFLGASPSRVRTAFPGLVPEGLRVLGTEEDAGRELITFLSPTQREKAIVAAEAPKEVLAAGAAQPEKPEAVGIGYEDLNDGQQSKLKALVRIFADIMPQEVVDQRLGWIESDSWENVRFAWFGSIEPEQPYAFRIQGKRFQIEVNNTQPDAEGNPANHVHTVWRDLSGDFDLPAGG